MKLSDLKEFPILGARDQRELVDEETWKAWMRSKGAYVAKIAPYNSRFAVMFGEENYVNVCRDLFSLEMSQHMEGAGGLITVPGMVDFDYMLHTVFLPEKYDALVYWHEALHLALFACEVFGINPLEQEAVTYLQGQIVKDMVYAREQYVADKKKPKVEDEPPPKSNRKPKVVETEKMKVWRKQ
ncbi:TPA: hypothetical protein ACQ850_002501 [Klebsiella pneumoniae]